MDTLRSMMTVCERADAVRSRIGVSIARGAARDFEVTDGILSVCSYRVESGRSVDGWWQLAAVGTGSCDVTRGKAVTLQLRLLRSGIAQEVKRGRVPIMYPEWISTPGVPGV